MSLWGPLEVGVRQFLMGIDFFSMSVTVIRLGVMIMFLGAYGFVASGCMPDTTYQAYEDQKKKGEPVFLKDLKVCRQFVKQNMKPSEGSEGAGERSIRKRSLFLLCMEDHNWILKQ